MWNFKCPGWNPRRFSVGRGGRLSQVEDEPDCDVYNDRITPKQWQELFSESNDEEEFHGF